MEGVLTFLAGISIIALFYLGVILFFKKFFGTKVHGRFGFSQAIAESEWEKNELERLNRSNPVLVQKAIQQCKQKHFALVPDNILTEVHKILEKESGKPSQTEQIKDKLRNTVNQFFKDNTLSKMEKIEKLNKLRKEEALTEEEYLKMKNEIL